MSSACKPTGEVRSLFEMKQKKYVHKYIKRRKKLLMLIFYVSNFMCVGEKKKTLVYHSSLPKGFSQRRRYKERLAKLSSFGPQAIVLQSHFRGSFAYVRWLLCVRRCLCMCSYIYVCVCVSECSCVSLTFFKSITLRQQAPNSAENTKVGWTFSARMKTRSLLSNDDGGDLSRGRSF